MSKRLFSDTSTWNLSTRSNGSSSRHTRQNSTRSSQRSSVSSVGQCSLRSNCTSRSIPQSSTGSSGLLSDVPEGIPEDEESGHKHWCTHCEHSKPIGTCDGWKRHEREHEIIYRCMPFGAVEKTAAGPECALCGTRSPSPSHLQEHHIHACAGTSRKPLTLSRRSNLVKHLTLHGIFGEKASSLADRWRYGWNKQAFSCGFCVMLFPTLSDRSSHIDNEHWKHGRDMSEWSLTNVIRGLLLQPGIKEVWESYLASDTPLGEASFRWELPKAEGLQLKLELGEDSAIDLANLAYQCGDYNYWALGQEVVSPETHQMDVGDSSLDGRRSTKTGRGLIINPTTSTEQQRTMAKTQSNSPCSNITTSRHFFLEARSSDSAERLAVHDGSSTSGYSWNDPLSTAHFLSGTSHTILPQSFIRSPRPAASAANPELHLSLESQRLGYPTPRGSPPIAHLPHTSVGYTNAIPSPEGQQQPLQDSSWTDDFDPHDAGMILDVRSPNTTFNSTHLHPSRHQSLEKPLPPLPDSQKAHSSALKATSLMDIDSD